MLFWNRHFSRADLQMATKHVKRLSRSSVVRETPTTPQCKSHSTPTRMAVMRRDRGQRVLLTMSSNRKLHTLQSHTRFNSESPHHPATPLPGIIPRRTENTPPTQTCTEMLAATLFKIAPKWKQPKCPSTDERVSGRSTQQLPQKGVQIRTTARRKPENMLYERSQTQRAAHSMFSYNIHRISKPTKTKTQTHQHTTWLPGAGKWGEFSATAKG